MNCKRKTKKKRPVKLTSSIDGLIDCAAHTKEAKD